MQYNVGTSCYSSTNCEDVDGVAPFIVSSLEECCLHNPFQPRSFSMPLTSMKDDIGTRCAQCTGKENHLSSDLTYNIYKNPHEKKVYKQVPELL